MSRFLFFVLLMSFFVFFNCTTDPNGTTTTTTVVEPSSEEKVQSTEVYADVSTVVTSSVASAMTQLSENVMRESSGNLTTVNGTSGGTCSVTYTMNNGAFNLVLTFAAFKNSEIVINGKCNVNLTVGNDGSYSYNYKADLSISGKYTMSLVIDCTASISGSKVNYSLKYTVNGKSFTQTISV